MALGKSQQYLGWALLLACLITIPIGLMSRSSAPVEEQPRKKGLSWLSHRDRILVVRIDGMIRDDEGEASILSGLDSATSARKKIRKAVEDAHVKGLLLRINSPGGTVGTSQEVYDAVRDFRANGRPAVVSMSDVAASGGYYIAAAADRIFALPGTLTGSIGVIMHLMNLQEMEKKVGVEPMVIKSGQFKDIGTMDRPATAAEKELLQSIIMDSYDQFVTAVSEGRQLDKNEVKKLADGRIYSGRQALKVKLVDELGGYDDALQSLQKMTRAKFNIKKDLDVDEGKGMGIFAALMEAGTKIPQGQGPGIPQGIIPESMESKSLNQPLWMMQDRRQSCKRSIPGD